MSSHLVETSEEDSFTAVSRHIGDLLNEGQDRTQLADTPGSKYTQDCLSLISEARFGELLSRWLSQIELLLAKAQDKDLECCINIVCHLVSRVPPPSVPAAAQQVESHPDVRLAGLSELYNVLTDSIAQLAVVTELLKYGKASGLAHLLVPVIQSGAECWPRELRLSPAQTRDLLLLCADVLRSSQKKKVTAERDAYKLTLRTLESLEEGASPQDTAHLKEAAVAAAAAFICSSEVYQFDLLECPAVAQLRDDPQQGPTFQLLSIMLSGDVQSFETFAISNSGIFEGLGSSQAEVLVKMRLMALLGLSAGAATVSYQNVQAALGVSEGEVESWVVQAIGKKLLEARIDQLQRSITVTRAAHRAFGAGQWQELHTQLSAWAENVRSVRQLVATQAQPGAFPLGLANGVRT